MQPLFLIYSSRARWFGFECLCSGLLWVRKPSEEWYTVFRSTVVSVTFGWLIPYVLITVDWSLVVFSPYLCAQWLHLSCVQRWLLPRLVPIISKCAFNKSGCYWLYRPSGQPGGDKAVQSSFHKHYSEQTCSAFCYNLEAPNNSDRKWNGEITNQKDHRETEIFWIWRRYWLQHLATSSVISSHRAGRFCGYQPGNPTHLACWLVFIHFCYVMPANTQVWSKWILRLQVGYLPWKPLEVLPNDRASQTSSADDVLRIAFL